MEWGVWIGGWGLVERGTKLARAAQEVGCLEVHCKVQHSIDHLTLLELLLALR